MTYRVTDAERDLYVKWAPKTSAIDLAGEARRLGWLAGRTPVPHVVDTGDDDEGSWLVTTALAGTNAIAPQWAAQPNIAIRAIAAGLRRLHGTLPVETCPFSLRVPARRISADRRRNLGLLTRERLLDEHRHLSIDEALEITAHLRDDDLVVCHGDPCPPNTIIDSAGEFAGHVDVGQLGVADRWADLAVAAWSAGRNYGAEWASRLLAEYGVRDDPERRAAYLLLYDLGP